MRARRGRCPGVPRAGAQGPGPESGSCSGSATGRECGGGIRAAGTRGDAPGRAEPASPAPPPPPPGVAEVTSRPGRSGSGPRGAEPAGPREGPGPARPQGAPLLQLWVPCTPVGPAGHSQFRKRTAPLRACGAAVHGSPRAAEGRASSQVPRVELFPFLNNHLGYSIR
ncbi:unnamed protein product [Nyctereutes procyonoides]|uniref:(raccoon dog) hypothetical protein n=1 Tax=Nyctereutes procyonoides TaxID=34880 RepID=A0A811YRY9_NYCPR|nr:unnamed protein product [Nyctereutes procyonoides]